MGIIVYNLKSMILICFLLFCKILIGSSLLIIRLQIEAIPPPPIMFVWSHFAKGYSKLVMMLLVWYERPIKVKKKKYRIGSEVYCTL